MSAFNYSANENRLVVVKHWAFKGYQALSLITPPVVLGLAAFRRGRTFTVNQLLRTTYISNSAGEPMLYHQFDMYLIPANDTKVLL
jgi:hypothetical protein